MKKIMTCAAAVWTAGILLLGFAGCEPADEYDPGADMYTHQFTVEAGHWQWNERYRRLEYVWEWDEIDQYMYEDGVVTAGVYTWEYYADGSGDQYEVLRSLPFAHTYSDRIGVYTQTFGFDISYSPQERFVVFYIQNSDLSRPDGKKYTFKVTLFWHQ